MFCINCGTQLPDEAKFCSNCGAPTHRTPSGSGSATQQAEREEAPMLAQRERTNQPTTGKRAFSVEVMPCTKCGAPNSGTYEHCASCGTPRAVTPEERDKVYHVLGEPMLDALGTGEISVDESVDLSEFVVEHLDKLQTHTELFAFLDELQKRWPIYSDVRSRLWSTRQGSGYQETDLT
jgi:ribosomal protein L40E